MTDFWESLGILTEKPIKNTEQKEKIDLSFAKGMGVMNLAMGTDQYATKAQEIYNICRVKSEHGLIIASINRKLMLKKTSSLVLQNCAYCGINVVVELEEFVNLKNSDAELLCPYCHKLAIGMIQIKPIKVSVTNVAIVTPGDVQKLKESI